MCPGSFFLGVAEKILADEFPQPYNRSIHVTETLRRRTIMAQETSRNSRRSFLGKSGAAVLAGSTLATGAAPARARAASSGKERVVLVGTGSRGSGMWGRKLIEDYSDKVEFVGLCDNNPIRMDFVKKHMGVKCPTFLDTQFDEMIEKTKPDRVIVTTKDCFHAKYIIRAMELGVDVITEKPMATDERMCQAILDTERRTGRKVTVTFNYRYGPDARRVKELLLDGAVGKVTSVDFAWYLDTSHGASYFRRWHAYKQNGGSLWVHKATHHFDLMNWWLDSEPVEVRAHGELRKYGHNGPFHSDRCMTCPHKDNCDFHWDITTSEFNMNMYVKAESADGYIRDACLYRQDINIWDTMAAQVRYHNRVMMNYSLNAFMPYEGFLVSFNGTGGRMDVRVFHRQWNEDRLGYITVTPLFGKPREYTLTKGEGGHGGADTPMQDMIFRGPVADPLGQAAGSRDGALSILVGIAARRSIEQGRSIDIDSLVGL
jgi:predicted dehydrogenase